MVIKVTNKDDRFYNYMGKFFGSRLVESQTNDRIYDDPDKEWYIYLMDDISVGFISLNKHVIKNIYATKSEYVLALLQEVLKTTTIKSSIVTSLYLDAYQQANLQVDDTANYKNFVIVSSNKEEKQWVI